MRRYLRSLFIQYGNIFSDELPVMNLTWGPEGALSAALIMWIGHEQSAYRLHWPIVSSLPGSLHAWEVFDQFIIHLWYRVRACFLMVQRDPTTLVYCKARKICVWWCELRSKVWEDYLLAQKIYVHSRLKFPKSVIHIQIFHSDLSHPLSEGGLLRAEFSG